MSPICPTLLLHLVMLPSALLAQTSDRMVTTVQEVLETRLAAQTASIETRLAAQTASLAAQTVSLEDRLEDRLAAQTTALHEKIASLEFLLTAATRDIGALVTAFQSASSQMAECCGRPVTTATHTVTPSTSPTTTPSTTPTTTETPTTTPATTEIPTTTPTTTETPTTTPATTETPTTTPATSETPTTTPATSVTPTTTPATTETPTTTPTITETRTTTPATTETPLPVVFLRRQDGSVDFYRDWAAYKSGFGNQAGEFWLGLDNLHTLTTRHKYSLRADLTDWSGETKWTEYSTFRVANGLNGYRLTVSGYNPNSTAGDSMFYNNRRYFSTHDRDNDGRSGGSCADFSQGAWWYGDCTVANPTGVYKPDGYNGNQGILWISAYNDLRSLKRVTLTLVDA